VEELYEQYRQDKNAVDRSWWPILESYRPLDGARSSPAAASSPVAPPEPATSPEPVAAPTPPRAPSAAPAPKGTEPRAVTAPIPVVGAPAVARTTTKPAAPQPMAWLAISRSSAPETITTGEDVVTPMRGMTKTLAANMDQSLTVPTATSVRTVPAKLMIDNRIVMNNHMARTRGGKVSFTHLIGWAIIQTLKEFPSQNVFYAEVDGKPSAVAPAHINLGIAIDLPKPDGPVRCWSPASSGPSR
jgi:2-oxoglutarate dehydrogenase E1 component